MLKRLKRINLKIKEKELEINNMHVRTMLISDFPQNAFAGVLEFITSGDHVTSGLIINFAVHFRPSALRFNKATNDRIKRLDMNLKAQNTGNITDTVRDEETQAVEGLIYLRDKTNGFVDVWVTVTFSSLSLKHLNSGIKKFEESICNRGWSLNMLEKEQHIGIDSAWIGGEGKSIFEKYPGRVMDINAIAAIYPLLNGSVSDPSGAYLAHRIADCTSFYKDFTMAVTDNESMMLAGTAGGGKSTVIKIVVISLLMKNYKGYIYDANGEYRRLKNLDGAVWVDYSAGSGLFVDPTIIEKPLLSEVPPGKFAKDSYEYEAIVDADKKRFYEAYSNTFAIIELLSENFTKEKQNALDEALIKMWEDAGIYRYDPDTWEIRSPQVGLIPLFERIKQASRKNPNAKALYEDLQMYHTGGRSYIFSKCDSGDWIKDANLVIYDISGAVDNVGDKRLNAIKIVSANHMTWQRIKRDRMLMERYSFEVKDELQRSINNLEELKYILRSTTDSRKFNNQIIMGFNNPAMLFKEDFKEGEAIWENTKYKLFFPLEERAIRTLAANANMPDEIVNHWLKLPQHSFIFSQKVGSETIYDILRASVPDSEIQAFAKTRGLA